MGRLLTVEREFTAARQRAGITFVQDLQNVAGSNCLSVASSLDLDSLVAGHQDFGTDAFSRFFINPVERDNFRNHRERSDDRK